ncbi:hypothetical protein H8D85_01985 [bacterium]|nr:hypothetical protein [bacterium]
MSKSVKDTVVPRLKEYTFPKSFQLPKTVEKSFGYSLATVVKTFLIFFLSNSLV